MALRDLLSGIFRDSKPVAAARDTTADTPENAAYWRRLGQAPSRDLPAMQHAEMVRHSLHASQADALGKAHMRLVGSITVGALEIGPEVQCGDQAARDALQRLVDLVWNDPVNKLGTELLTLMNGLTSTGSLCVTLHTSPESRITRFGILDPGSFVSPGVLTDPDNCLDRMAVLRSDPQRDGVTIAHPIMRSDGTTHDLFATLAVGDETTVPRNSALGGDLKVRVGSPCLYLGVNRSAPNQQLGISDLYASLDLVRLVSELSVGGAARCLNIGAYSLHVKFPKGMSRTAIDETMKVVRSDIESGSGRAVGTTEDISIGAVAANLQSGEWTGMKDSTKRDALTGLGPWPPHMFSDASATNVTAAAEQGSPVANFLLTRQNEFRGLWIEALTIAVRRFPEGARLLDAHPDAKIVISLPVIVGKNTTRESNVLSVETTTLTAARDAGLITTAAAQREFRDAANRYGFAFKEGEDHPPADEVDAARESVLSLPPLRPDGPLSEREQDPDQTRSSGTPAAA